MWMQTLEEVTANIPLPLDTTSKMLSVTINALDFKVALKSNPKEPIVAGKWCKKIKADDSTWVNESDGS